MRVVIHFVLQSTDGLNALYFLFLFLSPIHCSKIVLSDVLMGECKKPIFFCFIHCTHPNSLPNPNFKRYNLIHSCCGYFACIDKAVYDSSSSPISLLLVRFLRTFCFIHERAIKSYVLCTNTTTQIF